MLNWLINFSLRHRYAVIIGSLVLGVGGFISMNQLELDAFPDTTPVMVQINTVAPALGPEEVESQLTFPIEQSLSGLPKLELVRSISKFGLSQVVVIFEDGTDIYFARQLVTERLNTVELPEGLQKPELGPVSTGLGEVFHYIVTSEGSDLTDLRTTHDWVVKPTLRTVPGTAEVNSWGGYEKQFQVRIYPEKLVKHELTFEEVVEALEKNNRNVGGGSISDESETLLVHGHGRLESLDAIRNIILSSEDGVPVKLLDVADVEIGHEIRRGAVTADGKGEVVLGIGFMLMGENSHEVTWNMKDKLDEVSGSLPPGTRVEPVYDRTELVDYVIDTVRGNLLEGGLFVVVVLFLFLGNFRGAFIVALAIPLSMLAAFSGMLQAGIAASLLSLGAIDFGMVVDSSVVMVENCVRRLAGDKSGASKLDIIRDAAIEVRRPTLFGELIIMIVYLPILTLEGIEGKLFRPMALTVIFALAGSMLLSMTLMPALASIILPRRPREKEPLLMRLVLRLYTPVLDFALRRKGFVMAVGALILFVAFGVVAPNLGSEFVPRLSEGAIVINTVRLTGTSIEDSVESNTQIERAILREFPDEVEHVWSRIGTAEVATDPMGIELTDIFVTFKPRPQWKRASTQAELTEKIQRSLRDVPGLKMAYTQPIEMRINEMVSGVRTDFAVKIFGDDFDELVEKAQEVESILLSTEGSADVSVEQITGQPVLEVRVRQDQLARYGVPAQDVMNLVESLGSFEVGEVFQGQLRFPLVIRLPEKYREGAQSVRELLLTSADGEKVPLGRLADVTVIEGPSTITREWGQRRITVTCNVRGRDLGSFVEEAQAKVDEGVALPSARYRIDYGGQYENLIRAQSRLFLVVPLALALIFILLYFTYHNIIDSVRVFTALPFAWVGGIFALWIRGMPFSISAAIGFIALSGVAVLDDMILVSYINQLRAKGMPVEEAVTVAAKTRLRPVLMTTLVAALGFVPMAFNKGMGAEVQRPLATVVIGGVVVAMVMSLVVGRVVYVLSDKLRRPRVYSAKTEV
ncbi:MAG: efflux RND transporter permease subunit [Planctomycetes bacterium]|nr:efflux RND transporter permease subunit [Planctomycetota bacterium]